MSNLSTILQTQFTGPQGPQGRQGSQGTGPQGPQGSQGTSSVTSVATGNGLSGGPITSTGTLIVACPTWGSIGSYANGVGTETGSVAGTVWYNPTQLAINSNYSAAAAGISGGSGTWKCMGISGSYYQYYSYSRGCCVEPGHGVGIYQFIYLFCRVS